MINENAPFLLIFLDRLNSHHSQCFDCHRPAVAQWLPALWDWSIVVKSGKWMICSVSDTSKLNLLISVQLSPGELKEAMELHPPRLMICSVEFLASEEVLFMRTWSVFIFSEAVLIWRAGSKLVAGLSACTARQKANCCNWRGSSEKYLFLFKTLFVMLKFYAPAGSWPRGWVVRISGTLWHLHLAMVDSCNQSSVQKFLMSLWNTLISNFKQVSPSVSLHEWVVLAQNLRYYTFKCLLTPCWSTQQILTRLSWFSYTRHWPASDPGVLQGSFQAECVPAGAECRQDIDKVSKSYLIIRSNSFVTCPTNFSNFDRTCGFLYLFALSGKKIQVFCRSTDLVWRVGVYLKSIGNWILKFSDVRGLAEGTSWRKWVLFHQSEKVGWQQHTSTEEKDDGRLQIWVRLHTKIIRWTIWNMYQICDYLKYVSDMSRCCFVQRLPQWEFTVLTSVLVYHSVGKMCLSFYI